MSGNVSNFVNQYLPYAEQVSQQTGLPVDYVLGQAGEETGWGTSSAAVNQNNFFGISPGGSLATYSSPAEGFGAYANLIGSNYSGVNTSGSPFDIAQQLQSAGYASDPNYASNVAGAVNSVDQVLGAEGDGGGTGGSGTYNIFGPTGSWVGQTTDPSLVPSGDTYSPADPGNLLGGGQSGTPSGNSPVDVGSGNSTGTSAASESWWGELAERALIVIIGIVLIFGGLYIAGQRSSRGLEAFA